MNDTEKTKKCKFCQTDIPVKAKVCPNCQKKQNNNSCLEMIVIFLGVIVAFSICISNAVNGDKNKSNKTSSSSKSSVTINKNENTENTEDNSLEESAEETEVKDESNVVSVGDSFECQGLKISYDKSSTDYVVEDDKYGWYTPKDGHKYVSATFTFENTSDSDELVSVLDFDCYADDTMCEQEYLKGENDVTTANLSSGRKITFTVYYSVPKDAKSIELEYEADFWTDEKVIIKIQ